MPSTLTVRSEGLVLDAILAAKYDPRTARAILTEALELNPGLAALGPVLPIGTMLIIPDRPGNAVPAVDVVDLFGAA
ncbi:tail protein X [Aurantimonas sp. VKM B-3413]|uniref:tail protein X n=1 Tax=Aurantimonas sp. VKM B-3413 TaxID=2779401 RepID=UPI001E5166DF|nr:tail protein X [Aurantimonas sp. VKM B-3413]MCB8835921.1 tail protein X [Aurantimonas sp. VKM B-3413]